MKPKERYLIALDLDDTLLTKEKTISEKTLDYLHHLSQEGHLIVLDTGRPKRLLLSYYQQLDVDAPFIALNGAMIENPKDPTYPTFLKSFHKEEILDLLDYVGGEDNFVDFAIGNDEAIHFHTHYFERFLDFHLSESHPTYGNLKEAIQDDDLFCYLQPKDKEIKKKIDDFLKGHTDLAVRYYDDVYDVGELYFRDISKATGLEEVRQQYGISKDHIIAFGDSINDIDMLSYAGIGVCMCSGHEKVKPHADMLSKADNNHDGIMLTLMSLGIL